QINFLRENNEVGVLSNAYEIINDRGKVLRTVRLPLYHNEIEQAMTKHCSCCFPSSIMRTEAIHTVGGFNENLVSAEDFDLFLRLLPVTTFRNISSILFQYRKSPPSISVKEKLSMRRNTHTLSHNYLLARLSSEKDNSMVAGMCFRLGVNEYYHGSMRSAREYFFKSLRYGYNKKAVGRYLLPTMLGDTIFRVFRYFRNREYFLV
ncbi:MAG: hypothetical protein KGJ59_07415, partial [Bacteroidota bacterium]|nr:hypothetical protein [Bacteroidota bacterium]